MDTARVPGLSDARGQCVLTPSRRPGDGELHVGDRLGQAVEGRHQIGEALARLDGADGEDVRGFGFVA